MRYSIRDRIIELLQTLEEATEFIHKTDLQSHDFVYADFKNGLESIRNTFKESFSEETYRQYNKKLLEINTSLDGIYEKKQSNGNTSKETRLIKRIFKNLEKDLLNEEEVKLEVLFIPYKYSMWDSFESIWEAAEADTRCNAYVMPIPYYDRDDEGRMTTFHYEVENFVENNIPVISYEDYNYIERRPDVIYFHNPFDENNAVTSVTPEFYSSNLKHYTKELVYVPYFIASSYDNYESAFPVGLPPGIQNASTIILQSENLKEIYMANGVPERKIQVLGSPKIDFILKMDKENKVHVPQEWKEKIGDKKTVLLNSTIGRLLNEENYMDDLASNIREIIQNKEVVLLWRPHPLLEATIKSMRPHMLKDYLELKEYVQAHGILDMEADVKPSFIVSDGLLSDSSSIIRSYIVTEKPILFLEGTYNEEKKKIICANLLGCYYLNDGVSVQRFLEYITLDEDPWKENRIAMFKESVKNIDGKSGKKIYEFVLDKVLRS